MRNRLSRYSATLQRIVQALVLFALFRIALGVALIAMPGGEDAAWGLRLTIIAAIAAIVCLGAALAVRAWAPPRRG